MRQCKKSSGGLGRKIMLKIILVLVNHMLLMTVDIIYLYCMILHSRYQKLFSNYQKASKWKRITLKLHNYKLVASVQMAKLHIFSLFQAQLVLGSTTQSGSKVLQTFSSIL